MDYISRHLLVDDSCFSFYLMIFRQDEKTIILSGEHKVPWRFVSKNHPYKYAVQINGVISYERLEVESTLGGIVNRSLVIPRRFATKNGMLQKCVWDLHL